MRSVQISLTYEKGATPPLLERFFESPDLDREVILGGQVVDSVETVTSIVYGDLSAYESLLSEDDGVLEYDIVPSEDGLFVYLRRELESSGQSLFDTLAQKTLVVVPPITVRSDRTIRMTVVGHPNDLNTLFHGIPGAISVDIRRIQNGVTVNTARLSKRQRLALQTAWNVGYYEIPRRNGIETVAEELGCAVSTASEILRRGERRLIGQSLDVDR